MDSIEEASKRISKSLKDRYLELKEHLKDVNRLISSTAKEFKEASAKGDHSENAAYSEAKDKLTKLNTQKLYLLMDIESIENVTNDLKYVPKSYIDIYSTFRLERYDTKEITTWRVYPGSISDIDRGIMSSESPIYSLLEDREKNDIIKTTNRINGKTIEFKILEVY